MKVFVTEKSLIKHFISVFASFTAEYEVKKFTVRKYIAPEFFELIFKILAKLIV